MDFAKSAFAIFHEKGPFKFVFVVFLFMTKQKRKSIIHLFYFFSIVFECVGLITTIHHIYVGDFYT